MQAAVTCQELCAEVPAEGWGTQGRAEPVWAHGVAMGPQGRIEAREDLSGHMCAGAYCRQGRGKRGKAPQSLSFLRRPATCSRCLPPSRAEEGSPGLSSRAGKGYSHHLKGWQLIKDSRLQSGEDVSRYVSARDGVGGTRDRILGSPWAKGGRGE